MKLAFALTFLGFICLASAELGVDFTSSVNPKEKQLQCLYKKGYEFAFFELWRYDTINKNAGKQYRHAQSAGISHVDYVVRICADCENNITAMIHSINKTVPKKFDGRLWLTADRSDPWSSNTTLNYLYISYVAEQLYKSGYHIGIQTNASSWKTLFKTEKSKTTMSVLPLWYVDRDSKTTFSDSKSFSGWSTAELKQYEYNQKICGVRVNVDTSNSTSSSAKPSSGGTPDIGGGAAAAGGGGDMSPPTGGSGASIGGNSPLNLPNGNNMGSFSQSKLSSQTQDLSNLDNSVSSDGFLSQLTINDGVSQYDGSSAGFSIGDNDGGFSDGGISDGGISDNDGWSDNDGLSNGGISDGFSDDDGLSDGGFSDGGFSDGGFSDGGEFY